MNAPVVTQPTTKQFLNHIIDYAGMFPPAKLPFEEAFKNFLDHRESNNSWMLSRFIIPSSTIPKVAQFDDEIRNANKTIPFSVLLPRDKNIASFPGMFGKQIKLTKDLKDYFQGLVSTDILELRLPDDFQDANTESQATFLQELFDVVIEADIKPTHIFVETPLDKTIWEEQINTLTHHLNRANNSSSLPFQTGLKVRTGGITADLFPSVQQVSHAISKAKDHELPIKFTAGLHHPVRHFDEEINTRMYGFFNIFGACMLYYHDVLPADELPLILSEEHDNSFLFDNESFSWKEYSVSIKQIIEARDRFCASFGSCSFTEPTEDLQNLTLI